MLDRAGTIWIAALTWWALSAFRVFDILLLKRYLDSPLLVALWIGSLFVLLLVARLAARAVSPESRSWLQRRLAGIDRPMLALIGLGLLLLFAQHWGYQRAASDGREYFVQTRSLYMDLDLDLTNEKAFGVRGTASIYPFGAPLLWMPFYAAADAWLAVLNLFGADYPRDGYFNPYQRAVGLGSLVYGWIGLLLMMRLAAEYFGRPLAAASTIAIALGTFVAWYFVVDPSLPHAISMAAVAWFVVRWHATRETRGRVQWALLGAVAGLMSLVRWQNIGFAVLAGGDGVRDLYRAARAGDRSALTHSLGNGIAFGAGFLVAFAPQLWFWQVTRGSWLAAPAGAHDVRWTGPLRDVLFTPDHGLFTWSPLIALAVAGFAFFLPRAPRMATLLFVAFAFQVYVLGTVGSPGYGFGTRRLASCAVLFVLGLAAFGDAARRRPLAVPAALTATLIGVNLLFMLDVRQGQLPPTGPIRGTEIVASIVARVGNPLSMPMNVWFAWRHRTDLGHYERLGTQVFNNLRIDVGSAEDARFLVSGWAGREDDGNRAFRWSTDDSSALLAPLREPDGYTLVLDVEPFGHPDGRPQGLTVEVNGAAIVRLELRPGWQRHTVTLAPAHLRPGVNDLRFHYDFAVAPRELGLSEDSRRLAVRFDRIELLRD